MVGFLTLLLGSLHQGNTFRTLALKLSGSCSILHACLARRARLNNSKSLNPIPPISWFCWFAHSFRNKFFIVDELVNKRVFHSLKSYHFLISTTGWFGQIVILKTARRAL